MGTIVVGTDGSATADDAVRWAAGEAALRGATVKVVSAYDLPISVETLWLDVEKQLRTAAESAARRAEELVAELSPGTPVETEIADGPAVPALLRAVEGADLLVVGSHGHSALAGIVLGSVALHCAAQAPVSVVVVRRPPTRT